MPRNRPGLRSLIAVVADQPHTLDHFECLDLGGYSDTLPPSTRNDAALALRPLRYAVLRVDIAVALAAPMRSRSGRPPRVVDRKTRRRGIETRAPEITGMLPPSAASTPRFAAAPRRLMPFSNDDIHQIRRRVRSWREQNAEEIGLAIWRILYRRG